MSYPMTESTSHPLEIRRTGRFGIVQAAVVTRAGLSSSARLVYVGLTLHAGGTGQAWPSASTLADQLGLSRSTVYLALDELDDAGVIRRDRRKSAAGADRSTIVTLLDEGNRGSVRSPDTTSVRSSDTGSVRSPDGSVRSSDTTSVRSSDTNKKNENKTRARDADGDSRPDSRRPHTQCGRIHDTSATDCPRWQAPDVAARGAAAARAALAAARS